MKKLTVIAFAISFGFLIQGCGKKESVEAPSSAIAAAPQKVKENIRNTDISLKCQEVAMRNEITGIVKSFNYEKISDFIYKLNGSTATRILAPDGKIFTFQIVEKKEDKSVGYIYEGKDGNIANTIYVTFSDSKYVITDRLRLSESDDISSIRNCVIISG